MFVMPASTTIITHILSKRFSIICDAVLLTSYGYGVAVVESVGTPTKSQTPQAL